MLLALFLSEQLPLKGDWQIPLGGLTAVKILCGKVDIHIDILYIGNGTVIEFSETISLIILL